MKPFCAWRRIPRAGVDPIRSASDALTVITAATHRPLRAETLALLLDADRRGRAIVVVSGTDDPDAVISVAECVATALSDSAPEGGGLVIATVRPGSRLEPDDADRWLEASQVTEAVGVDLVEWFVLGGDADNPTVECPRDVLGERPRW